MPTRTARTAWNGGLQDGSGQVELSSSKVGTFDVSFPKRAADDADGPTSPEELVAANDYNPNSVATNIADRPLSEWKLRSSSSRTPGSTRCAFPGRSSPRIWERAEARCSSHSAK